MQMPLAAVIFDMDGVIIDSEPLHEKAQSIVFERHRLEVPPSVYTDFKGQTEEDVFDYVVEAFGDGTLDASSLVRQKHEAYAGLMDEMEPIAGALEFIAFLSAAGYALGLTTSAIRDNQQRAFEKFGLSPFFRTVVTAEDVTRPKPDPQPYRITASRMGVEPEKCLVIEDSLHGVRSALAAGCQVAALTTSFGAEALATAGARYVYDSFADLRSNLPS